MRLCECGSSPKISRTWIVLQDPRYMGRGSHIFRELVLALNRTTLHRGRHACVVLHTEEYFHAKKTWWSIIFENLQVLGGRLIIIMTRVVIWKIWLITRDVWVVDGGWCYYLSFLFGCENWVFWWLWKDFFSCSVLSFWWIRLWGLDDGGFGFGLRWVVVDGLWFARSWNYLLLF